MVYFFEELMMKLSELVVFGEKEEKRL